MEFLLERFNPTRFFVWMTLGPLDAKHHTLSVLHVPSTPHAHTKRIPPAYHRCTSSSSQTHCIHVPDVPHSYTRHTSRTRQAQPICIPGAPHLPTRHTRPRMPLCIPPRMLSRMPSCMPCTYPTRHTAFMYQTYLTHIPDTPHAHTKRTQPAYQVHLISQPDTLVHACRYA